MSDQPKKKIAILGGGAGSMACAYYLTANPAIRDQLEVTVYQLGWRLGGKGASGRNQAMCNRIEEHGLHVWGGFYYNSFASMQAVYGQINRPAGAPLRTWQDGFKPFDLVAWEEFIGGEWLHWLTNVPENDGIPGQGDADPSLWDHLQMLIGWVKDVIENFPNDSVKNASSPLHSSWLSSAIHLAEGVFGIATTQSPLEALGNAKAKAAALAANPGPHLAVDHSSVLHVVHNVHEWFKSACLSPAPAPTLSPTPTAPDTLAGDFGNLARRMFILSDLVFATIRGVIRDRVLTRGIMAIDDIDLTDWLAKHGATTLATTSAPLRGFYDYFFAYQNGDPTKPQMSAGMGIHHLLRLVGEYKGSMFWKMTSGMGDAAFGPLYQACVQNGVKFKFFHRVENLSLTPDNTSIATVSIARQVDLKVPEYSPLIDVLGLPSWPSAPLYDQINDEQAKDLIARGVCLEDPWADWNDVEHIELKAGQDFDAVVLGISIGAFPAICSDLIAANSQWKNMVANIQAIQTAAMQLWFIPTVDELGWSKGNATGTGYGQPLESWSDMSHVIPRETWPADKTPGAIIYFCGPMLNAQMPSGKDPDFGKAQTAAAWNTALTWSTQYLHHLYENATLSGKPNQIDWTKLSDPNDGQGQARFEAQFARANYTPSERYVVDLPGTNKYRLEAWSSGYTNLVLAGDWIFTGNGGAVESAFISGMQASRTICGFPAKIVGEMLSPWPRPRSVQQLVS